MSGPGGRFRATSLLFSRSTRVSDVFIAFAHSSQVFFCVTGGSDSSIEPLLSSLLLRTPPLSSLHPAFVLSPLSVPRTPHFLLSFVAYEVDPPCASRVSTSSPGN